MEIVEEEKEVETEHGTVTYTVEKEITEDIQCQFCGSVEEKGECERIGIGNASNCNRTGCSERTDSVSPLIENLICSDCYKKMEERNRTKQETVYTDEGEIEYDVIECSVCEQGHLPDKMVDLYRLKRISAGHYHSVVPKFSLCPNCSGEALGDTPSYSRPDIILSLLVVLICISILFIMVGEWMKIPVEVGGFAFSIGFVFTTIAIGLIEKVRKNKF